MAILIVDDGLPERLPELLSARGFDAYALDERKPELGDAVEIVVSRHPDRCAACPGDICIRIDGGDDPRLIADAVKERLADRSPEELTGRSITVHPGAWQDD